MPHLLDHWPQVRQRLLQAKRVLLLSDYDGTLAPIVDRPELARLPPQTRDSLVELSTRLPSGPEFLVGIISARSLEDVASRVGIHGLIYAGNHGLAIQGPGLDFVHPEALRIKDRLDQVYVRLKQELAVHPGAFAEHKGLSLTVHYRLVLGEGVEAVKDTVEMATLPYVESGDLAVSPGKMALEIRPNIPWDKGSAISTIQAALLEYSGTGVDLVMYLGDDLPDEPGFAAAQEAGGIGVFVGPTEQSTCANYQLNSPQEVGQFLHLIQQFLGPNKR